MTAVDLTFARQRARDRVLIDRVKVFRNVRKKRDAEFDDEFGNYTSDATPENTVAEDVPAMATQLSAIDVLIGGQTVTVKRWSVKLGYEEAPNLIFGDVVEFTTSADPELEGKRFHVNDIVSKTLRVWREVEVVRRQDGIDRT